MLKLSEKYKKEVVPAMRKEFGYANDLAVPRIERVIINCGFGKQVSGKSGKEGEKIQKHILGELSSITGQKPALRKAKKSISSFKLRKGIPIGAMVTLRGRKMYDFLERLIFITFPRTRDFRGLDPESVDQKGNLCLGFKEHTSFPEISAEREKSIFGLEIVIVTTADNKKQGLKLLRLLGFPIKP